MDFKRFLSFMKHTLLVAVVLTTVGISGCDDDDDGGPTVFNGTIMDYISSDEFKQSENGSADESLDSLVKYLNANPDLVATLDGTAEFTLFAPNNTAFISLLATPGFPADIRDINPAVIKGVLAYHMVTGTVLKADLTPTGTGTGTTTLYSDTNPCSGAQTAQVIKVNDNGTLLTGSTNLAIEFQETDKRATNGVVHVTKTVLIPPSVGASLTPILGKLSATILLATDFSHLAKAMTKADCGSTGVTPIAAMLSGAGPYTAFLPPNPVFEGTATAMSITVDQLIANFTAAQWRAIILNHIVAGTNNLANLTNGLQVTTLLNANAKLTVTDVPVSANTPKGKILGTSGAGTGLPGTQQAPILISDVAASNGVAHVVGKILIPN
jgi:uncharacterized surface protein with fasciclin (FAS1) repeats